MKEAKETKKKGKVGKVILWILLGLLILLVILTIWNQICTASEKRKVEALNYGNSTINIDGHNLNLEIVGDMNEKTIILLPGLGTPSPVMEFRPLAEALSDTYRVVTLEPFGYGLSETADTPRTVNTVVSELHSAVDTLGYTDYYLMAHSFSGIYSLAWANQFPDEVDGFIGIDPSVPKQLDCNPYPINTMTLNSILITLDRFLTFSGIKRLMTMSNPASSAPLDPDYPYTDADYEALRMFVLDRCYNKSALNEDRGLKNALLSTREMTFPKSVPVLNFVSASNCEIMPEWEPMHHDIITDTEYSEVVKLNGQHYLHLDNKQNIVDKVKEWIPTVPTKDGSMEEDFDEHED